MIINGKDRHLNGCKKATTPHRRFMAEAPISATISPTSDLTAFFPPTLDQELVGCCVYNSSLRLLLDPYEGGFGSR